MKEKFLSERFWDEMIATFRGYGWDDEKIKDRMVEIEKLMRESEPRENAMFNLLRKKNIFK